MLLEKQKSLGSKLNQDDVKQLMEMGYTKAQVEEALCINEGNKEHAATYLLHQAQNRKDSPKKS